jgi:transcriptional regulator with XRE-family HTH domain
MAKQQETFGQRLRRLRKAADFTQAQLAFQAGLTAAVVVTLEAERVPGTKDRVPDPRMSTLTALARVLGVGVGELVEGESNAPKKGRKQ